MENNLTNLITNNKDLISIVISISSVVLTILGWIAISVVNSKQQKKNLQNSAKMRVYEEFYEINKEISEDTKELSLLLSSYALPFKDMEFKKIISKENNNYQEQIKIWFDYLGKIREAKYKFDKSYMKLWIHSEAWISLIPKLKKAKIELFEKQIGNVGEEIYKYNQYLLNFTMTESSWEKWNQEEIKQKADLINKKFDEVAYGYIDDYMTMIHNHLLSSIVDYKKKQRENSSHINELEKYNVLTEKGLEEIINKKK